MRGFLRTHPVGGGFAAGRHGTLERMFVQTHDIDAIEFHDDADQSEVERARPVLRVVHDADREREAQAIILRLVLAERPAELRIEAVMARIGDQRAHVRVLAPALNSRLAHWVSDVDCAIRQAEERMASTIGELRHRGMTVDGEVGDADPMLAISDALHTFDADQIIISTWPAASSNWLEKDLPRRAAESFKRPIHHLTSIYDAPVVSKGVTAAY